METLLALCIGLGLAAACGFRVFVPLAALSFAAKAGLVNLGNGFEWLATWPAVIGFASACVLEIAGYYIPWIDHALDTIATPAAAVAGALVTASQLLPSDAAPLAGHVSSMHPFLKWAASIIGGGGIAGLVQLSTVATRSVSTITTAGLGNPVVATAENALSSVLSLLAILAPALAGLLVIALAWVLIKRWARRRSRRAARAARAAFVPSRALA